MPKFKAGDLVVMKEYGLGPDRNVKVVLIREEDDDHMACMICSDPDCCEWSNALGVNGVFYYHLSECQLAREDDI